MECTLSQARIDAYVDGELEPTPMLELDQHLLACADCRAEVSLRRLLKGSVRELARDQHASLALRRRIEQSLDAASGRAEPALGASRWTGVLSVAAMVALGLGAWVRTDDGPAASKASLVPSETQPLGLLGDIVARHVDQLPADITAERPEQVTAWSRGKVGFRVRSVEWSEPRVRLLGARVSHIGDRQAVKLYYGVGDSRLTTVVFQAPPSLHQVLSDDRVASRLGLHRAHIGSRVLSYHNVQGYTVPVVEHDGVAYAFTGDLDQRQLLQLVAGARVP